MQSYGGTAASCQRNHLRWRRFEEVPFAFCFVALRDGVHDRLVSVMQRRGEDEVLQFGAHLSKLSSGCPSKTVLQVFKCESFAYNASSDVIQAEQVADTQLKGVLQEWEGMMETFKAAAEERVAEELNPTVYPQVRQHAAARRSFASVLIQL